MKTAYDIVTSTCIKLGLPRPDTFITVNIERQQLSLFGREIEKNFPVSTSRFGTGSEEGSCKTPPGLHRIAQKIGNNAPLCSIFRDRINTGIIWKPGMEEENQILTRILRLEGLEPGKNSGPGIDSFERYIYIHGTNREEKIGTPNSHGCVCMKNDDIVELFDIVQEGTLVHIS